MKWHTLKKRIPTIRSNILVCYRKRKNKRYSFVAVSVQGDEDEPMYVFLKDMIDEVYVSDKECASINTISPKKIVSWTDIEYPDGYKKGWIRKRSYLNKFNFLDI